MTRSEFIENINEWDELMEFCLDNNLSSLDDVVSESQKDEQINDDLLDFVRHNDWATVADVLNDIPREYEYYSYDGSLEYTGLDDYSDFDAYKNDVLNEADNKDIWDPEDEEDEDDIYDEEDYVEDDCGEPEEPFSLTALCTMCNGTLEAIKESKASEKRNEDTYFDEFVSNFVLKEIRKSEVGVL